ncbi:MAG: CHASE domain-containing protein, partial [Candidatus Omnitrophica bacterium]|nr:CHASE domain-containing protein [Candidatus Omnitrophota bacterium]
MPTINEDLGFKSNQKSPYALVLSKPYIVWVILALSLGLTFFAYKVTDNYVNRQAQDAFNFRAQELEKNIQYRLWIYEQVLHSTVAFIHSSEYVSRKEWAQYINSININKRWPGIQAIGLSVPIYPNELEQHLQEMRNQGLNDYKVYPLGKRDFYTSIIYIEPFDWRNKRALGYDMWSDDVRRQAMYRSRDTGEVATSGLVKLVQETEQDAQNGFLTYVPVYKTKSVPQKISERRDEFFGWVYAAFRAGDLMKGVLSEHRADIEFEIFDGQIMRPDTLLYDSNKAYHRFEGHHQPAFSKTVTLTMQGQPWTIHFHSRKKDSLVKHAKIPWIVAGVGLGIDGLIFYVILSLYYVKRKTERMASDINKELEDQKQALDKHAIVAITNLKGKIIYANEKF